MSRFSHLSSTLAPPLVHTGKGRRTRLFQHTVPRRISVKRHRLPSLRSVSCHSPVAFSNTATKPRHADQNQLRDAWSTDDQQLVIRSNLKPANSTHPKSDNHVTMKIDALPWRQARRHISNYVAWCGIGDRTWSAVRGETICRWNLTGRKIVEFC